MELNFRNVNLLNLILKWFKLLLAIQVVVFLISIVFSSPRFIKPEFKSWAVVYPVNTQSYSDESASEQMVEVFNASEIRENIVEKFHLLKHYNIDENQKYAQSKMSHLYHHNVTIAKTQADAVGIEVLDKDPLVAKQMVDAILEAYELKMTMLHRNRNTEKVGMWDRAIQRKLSTIDSLKKELRLLAIQDGLIDFDAQTNEVVKGYLGTVEGGLTKVDKRKVGEMKGRLNEKGGDLIVTMDRLKEENLLLSELVAKHDEASTNLDAQETYMDIIESPIVSDKSVGAFRLFIVLGSMLLAALISLTFLTVFEGLELKK